MILMSRKMGNKSTEMTTDKKEVIIIIGTWAKDIAL